jgi:divalent metal cation (Fe/Co/Zn/Cd) transporter
MELHVEVPPGETLSAAHARVSQLERDLMAALPDVTEVITHIEPEQTGAQPAIPDTAPTAALCTRALELLHTELPDADWHHVQVYPANGGFALTLHVTLPSQLTVEAAHRVAENAETLLRTRLPELERITIHTEPPE